MNVIGADAYRVFGGGVGQRRNELLTGLRARIRIVTLRGKSGS
jgi:hypothetical protein